jgi:hypothetical protein
MLLGQADTVLGAAGDAYIDSSDPEFDRKGLSGT